MCHYKPGLKFFVGHRYKCILKMWIELVLKAKVNELFLN